MSFFLFNFLKTYVTIVSHVLQLNKMIIKTNLLEDYVNFVDNTKKQNKYFTVKVFLIVIIIFLFLFFLLSQYVTK